jgi:hypothetical protein
MPMSRKTNRLVSAALLAGASAFVLTAAAYGVMIAHRTDPSSPVQVSAASAWLIDFMDRYGLVLLFVELGAMALATLILIAAKENPHESQS